PALDQLLGSGVVQVADGRGEYDYGGGAGEKKKDEAQPVDFVVRYEVGLTGALYESVHEKSADLYGVNKRQEPADKKFLGIAFFWDFGMKFQGEEKAALQLPVRLEAGEGHSLDHVH